MISPVFNVRTVLKFPAYAANFHTLPGQKTGNPLNPLVGDKVIYNSNIYFLQNRFKALGLKI